VGDGNKQQGLFRLNNAKCGIEGGSKRSGDIRGVNAAGQPGGRPKLLGLRWCLRNEVSRRRDTHKLIEDK